jgi:hypothetical protein
MVSRISGSVNPTCVKYITIGSLRLTKLSLNDVPPNGTEAFNGIEAFDGEL